MVRSALLDTPSPYLDRRNLHVAAPRSAHVPRRRLRRGGGVTVLARLAGFAAVLALVFGTAAFAGSRLDVHPGKPAASTAGGMSAMAPQPVRGLAVSDRGLTLELARTTARRGTRFDLSF